MCCYPIWNTIDIKYASFLISNVFSKGLLSCKAETEARIFLMGQLVRTILGQNSSPTIHDNKHKCSLSLKKNNHKLWIQRGIPVWKPVPFKITNEFSVKIFVERIGFDKIDNQNRRFGVTIYHFIELIIVYIVPHF